MNVNHLLVLAGLVFFLASATFLALSGSDPLDLGAPRVNANGVELLSASVPPIGDFKTEFYVNDDNPFVPYDARMAEKKAINKPITVASKGLPKPQPPVNPVERPALSFPPRATGGSDAPVVKMIIAHENGDKQLTMELGGKEHLMKEGETVQGWKLLELSHGSAKFTDPSGGERLFIIAVGSNTAAAPKAGTPLVPLTGTNIPMPPGQKPQPGQRPNRQPGSGNRQANNNLPKPPTPQSGKQPVPVPGTNTSSSTQTDPSGQVWKPQRVWPGGNANPPPRPPDPAVIELPEQPTPPVPPQK